MSAIPAYSPRWLWRIYRFFERLPVPYWLFALFVAVALGLAKHLIAWDLDLLPRGRFNAYLAASGVYIVAVPFVWQVLNYHAVNAFAELRTKVGEQQLSVSLSQFLSLPAFPALLLAVLGALVGYSEFNRSAAALEPLSVLVLPEIGAAEWSMTYLVLALLSLRVIVQISLLRRILNTLDLDVFDPGPIYTLSRYCAAYTATVLFTFHGLILLSLPSYYLSRSGLVLIIVLTASALCAFIAPLTAINARLGRAKEALLCRLGEDQRRINELLHQAVSAGTLGSLAELRVAVGVLKEQREVLERLSTWPWLGQSIKGVAPALLVPVVVYVAQRLLSLVLGF